MSGVGVFAHPTQGRSLPPGIVVVETTFSAGSLGAANDEPDDGQKRRIDREV